MADVSFPELQFLEEDDFDDFDEEDDEVKVFFCFLNVPITPAKVTLQ